MGKSPSGAASLNDVEEFEIPIRQSPDVDVFWLIIPWGEKVAIIEYKIVLVSNKQFETTRRAENNLIINEI